MSDKKSYGQVLKSSSIMGGAASITMLIQMVRVKFAAVFLGVLGVGVVSNMLVVQNLVTTFAGLGVNTSGVKSISEAVVKGDEAALGRVVLALKRVSLLLGLVGAGLTVILSGVLSNWLFGDDAYTAEIALLGVAVFFTVIANAQRAIIQGMRRIGSLAKADITSELLGAVIIIVLYVYLGVKGIVFGLVAFSFIRFFVAFFIVRQINILPVTVTWKESLCLSGNMIRLGVAFMWTLLLSTAVLLITNALISNQISLEAVGIFSAAFALSGMFVNFVLNAMQADYYPRLVSAVGDKEQMNKMVNEQTEIGLLLVTPGILITLALAPWIIIVFYSTSFLPAVDLLQWFILGCLGRVVHWPMGFLQIALGKSGLYAGSQTLFSLVHILFIWIGVNAFGLVGVSIAFASLYMFFSIWVMLYISNRLTGFKWSSELVFLLKRCMFAVGLEFAIVSFIPFKFSIYPAIAVFILTSIFCLKHLAGLLGPEHLVTRNVKKYLG